jgi:hypothetical protein
MKKTNDTTRSGPEGCAAALCSPLVVDLLQRIIGVADALSVMEGLPGQTKGERAIWFSCSLQIKEAVAEVVPNWDDVLKAAHEANNKLADNEP